MQCIADAIYFSHSFQVSNCVAFMALHFQSCLSLNFLQVLLFKMFIEGNTLPSSMPFALKNSFHIVQHTDMLLLSLTEASSPSLHAKVMCNMFLWWNKQTRPYGTSLPLCFPVCGALQCWDQPVWSGLTREGSWSIWCANPHCSLDKNGA
ncbi:hypothetical protein PAXRUDRAFT_163759 [Paxillus rubicundulus Ve08.2h10]|uniref:Uncharacterized protein n=1 Tax=Paxillus rubicundulus Ve08.2h10 TaxID=930991 RepID=A0A0D0D4J1_9AGAM|nr:hypothetical protein PAXRUDRAFT_163759 [Paxillus rubicundulus Ve08.2h10]